MILSYLSLGLSSVVIFLFLWAAVIDVRTMRIPNTINLALLAAYPLRIILNYPGHMIVLQDLGFAFAVLICTFPLFIFKKFGGGDLKLAFTGSLWVGWAMASDFLLTAGLLGGIMSFGVYFLRYVGKFEPTYVAPFANGIKNVPYGVPLMISGIMVTVMQMPTWGLI